MFSVKYEPGRTPQRLLSFANKFRDTTPLMRQISFDMAKAVDRSFTTETSPSGVPFKPLSPRYREQRFAQGFTGPILQKSGRMRATIRRTHASKTVIVGSTVPYAPFQNAVRPFLGFSRQLKRQIRVSTIRFFNPFSRF